MLKRIILPILFLAVLQSANAQQCKEAMSEAMEMLPIYYEQGQFEKIDSLTRSFEQNCGKWEFIERLKLLRSLKSNTFSPFEFDYDHYLNLLTHLEAVQLKALMDSVHENPAELYLYYFNDPARTFKYNAFTTQLAESLIPTYSSLPECSSERMILNAYSGDIASFSRTVTDPACQAIPANYFRRQISSIQNRTSFESFIHTGSWIPLGNNRTLGVHPVLGFGMGIANKKWLLDLTMEFRFLQSSSPYSVVFQGGPVETKKFFGGYVGLDGGREVAKSGRSRFFVHAGIGFDGFDAIPYDENRDPQKGVSINSLNVNGGLSWRIYNKHSGFTGLDVRHNFVNYKNEGGTPLDGNTVTVRLLFGLNARMGVEVERRLKSILKY